MIGITNSSTKLTLKRLILKNRPQFIFVAEPWMVFPKFPTNWIRKLHLKMVALNNIGNLDPNLLFFYDSDLNLDILAIDDQFIYFTIKLQYKYFGLAAIYASINYVIRRDLWIKISNISSNHIIHWCFLGDFDIILGARKYMVSRQPTRIIMENFSTWTNSNHLLYIPTTREIFTWNNGIKGYANI